MASLFFAAGQFATSIMALDQGNKPNPISSPLAPTTLFTYAVATVYNKVAVGAADAREDVTPAYLSTKPETRCMRRACKLPMANFVSGQNLILSCLTLGDRVANYNASDPESAVNPYLKQSILWYVAMLPDGRRGYISDVWLKIDPVVQSQLPSCNRPV